MSTESKIKSDMLNMDNEITEEMKIKAGYRKMPFLPPPPPLIEEIKTELDLPTNETIAFLSKKGTVLPFNFFTPSLFTNNDNFIIYDLEGGDLSESDEMRRIRRLENRLSQSMFSNVCSFFKSKPVSKLLEKLQNHPVIRAYNISLTHDDITVNETNQEIIRKYFFKNQHALGSIQGLKSGIIGGNSKELIILYIKDKNNCVDKNNGVDICKVGLPTSGTITIMDGRQLSLCNYISDICK